MHELNDKIEKLARVMYEANLVVAKGQAWDELPQYVRNIWFARAGISFENMKSESLAYEESVRGGWYAAIEWLEEYGGHQGREFAAEMRGRFEDEPAPIRCATWCQQYPNCGHDWSEWERTLKENNEGS